MIEPSLPNAALTYELFLAIEALACTAWESELVIAPFGL
jgi:hypothetical protein